MYAGVHHYTYRARPCHSLRYLQGIFDFLDFYATSSPSLCPVLTRDSTYSIDRLHLRVREHVLGLGPAAVMAIPRRSSEDFSVRSARSARTEPLGRVIGVD